MQQLTFNFRRQSLVKPKEKTQFTQVLPEVPFYQIEELSNNDMVHSIYNLVHFAMIHYHPSRQEARNLIQVDANETNLNIEE